MQSTWLRSIFQVNLKTMLWLVVVVAIGMGWYRDRTRLDARVRELERQIGPQYSGWGVEDVLGKPDEPSGTGANAWCPATEDGQNEWLEVQYARRVRPKKILIYETYATGAVTKVSMFDWWGREVVVWTGADPTPRGKKGLLSIPVNGNLSTSRVKIYLDSANVAGWNCIDAVGLQSSSGSRHWANSATASSSYADRYSANYGSDSLTTIR